MNNPTQDQIEGVIAALNGTSECVCALFGLMNDLERSGNPLVVPGLWQRALEAQQEVESAFMEIYNKAAIQAAGGLQ